MVNTDITVKKDLLLSEFYQKVKDKITLSYLESYRNRVRLILAKENRTEEEDLFVNDFLTSIVNIQVKKVTIGENPGGLQATTSQQQHDEESQGPNQAQVMANQTFTDNWQLKSADVLDPIGPAKVVKLNDLVVIPSKFDGSRVKARRWLDDYLRAAVSNSWNYATMAKYFQAYLAGSALDWFAVMVQSDASRAIDWNNVYASFCRFYIGKDEDLALERSLKDSIQQNNESCSSFIARYARLIQLSDPTVSQSKIVNSIRIRLRAELVERLSSHAITDLESLNIACAGIEDGIKASRSAELLRRKTTTASTSKSGQYQQGEDRPQKKNHPICSRCERPGHDK